MANILTRRVSPIHISFPLLRRPRLTVGVWRRFTPERKRNILSIEVANVGGAPVEITGVHVGFMHTFLPAELLLGTRAVRVPLHDLGGDPQPPCVLDGDPLGWTANLDQIKEQLVAEQLRFSPPLRRRYADLADIPWPQLEHVYTELAEIEPELGLNRGPRGRLATMINNVSRELSHRRLAVVVQYGRGGLYKAKARLEPPPWVQRHRPH